MDFERFIKRNLTFIHSCNKATSLIKLSSGVLFCPLGLFHRQLRLTCLVCFDCLYKWADKFKMYYGLASLKNRKYCEIKPAYLKLKMAFCGFFHSEVLSTKEELRNSSLVNTTHITLKMSIFCRQFQDRVFGRVPVMEGSLTTVGELWIRTYGGRFNPYPISRQGQS